MSTEQKIIKNKIGLLRLAEELGNVSRACKVMGYSRDTFYRYQQAVEEGGFEALVEKSRRKANFRNRVAPEIEEAVLAFGENRTLGIRKVIVFEATYSRPTRSRAYASPAPSPRPSPGSLPARTGSPLAGRDLHPLDDKRNFKEPSHYLLSQSTSRAWSH